ncbi:hypothetical protein J2850_003839 [Azospirillum picis]|uniref:Uncharacterized protein n=1 Tax=Azospirillum picis TaxID=488438 RepID=A0ABU0MNY8_9PROT|nr:hypothetical protein [Azospirillum picis]MDQ0534918.1 hypothetical protein [Azospirillum picis]
MAGFHVDAIAGPWPPAGVATRTDSPLRIVFNQPG